MEVTINGISCVGTVEECKEFINKTMETAEAEEYVDLDLPSGKKWAKCNIGATKETERGLYFQWGDIVGRTAGEVKVKNCNWVTVPFGITENFDSIKDMVCPNGILSKEYDTVYIHTHGKAHMPTKEDFEELTANTNSSWEENFNGSGVNGIKFTSKKEPSKYIFIPAAGYTGRGSLYDQGSVGGVWSSSLCSFDPSNVWKLYFDNGALNIFNNFRCYGYSVRGIMD